MDRQTLRDWVHRYNALGPDGLGDAPRRNGPPPRLSASQQAQIAAWVRQGPDLERDEPRRVFRRLFCLSQATMVSSFSCS